MPSVSEGPGAALVGLAHGGHTIVGGDELRRERREIISLRPPAEVIGATPAFGELKAAALGFMVIHGTVHGEPPFKKRFPRLCVGDSMLISP